MNYLRYKNGNGKYWGPNAFIDSNSYLDKDSSLFDNADVWESTLMDTTVAYHSRVRNSTLMRCRVGDAGYSSEVVNAFMRLTRMDGGTVMGATILNCHIAGDAVIQGNCYLENCTVLDAVVIEQSVRLKNLKLHGKMRIGYGNWSRPPRYAEVASADGSIVLGITESTDGHAYIACQRKPIKDWLNKAGLFGRIAGWDEDTMEQAVQVLREWV